MESSGNAAKRDSEGSHTAPKIFLPSQRAVGCGQFCRKLLWLLGEIMGAHKQRECTK